MLLVAAAVVAATFVLAEIALVVLPLIAAMFATALLMPAADRLRAGGLPSAAAALAVLTGALAALAAVFALVVPSAVDQFDRLDVNVTGGVDRVQDWLEDGPLDLSEGDVSDATDSALDEIRSKAGELTDSFVAGAVLAIEILAGALLALVLTFFLLKDGRGIWSWLLDLVPRERRDDMRALGAASWDALGSYLRGISLSALAEAVLVAILLVVLGVPLVLALAVLTFFGAFIPIVGAFLVGLLAALVALFSEGLDTAVLVVAGFIVVQQLEGNLLHPVIVGRSVELHPMAVLLAVVAGGVLAGIVGAFLAVPLVAVGAAALAHFREQSEAAGEIQSYPHGGDAGCGEYPEGRQPPEER